MIPVDFGFTAPLTLQEAADLLEQHGDSARLLAGGHSLIPLMKMRLAQPSLLIDLSCIKELKEVRDDDGGLLIGAMTPHAQVAADPQIRERFPLLSEAASLIGDVQVRNRGTLGGSLAHADPAADLPAVMLALDADLELFGPAGRRTVPARSFFEGMFTTSLAPAEILTAVRLRPLPRRTGTAYQKAANLASGYAIVGVAAVVMLDQEGAIASARIGITGAAAQPLRAVTAEAALMGRLPVEGVLSAAATAAMHDVEDPLDDMHASAEYRRHLVGVHTRRALERAVAAVAA